MNIFEMNNGDLVLVLYDENGNPVYANGDYTQCEGMLAGDVVDMLHGEYEHLNYDDNQICFYDHAFDRDKNLIGGRLLYCDGRFYDEPLGYAAQQEIAILKGHCE